MPQAQNIAINDGKATPTTITLKPKSVGADTLLKGDAPILAGAPSLRLRHRLATASAPANSRMVLQVPVVEDVDGTDKVTRFSTITIECITSPESSAAERKDLRVLASNLLKDATIESMIDDGEQVW